MRNTTIKSLAYVPILAFPRLPITLIQVVWELAEGDYPPLI